MSSSAEHNMGFAEYREWTELYMSITTNYSDRTDPLIHIARQHQAALRESFPEHNATDMTIRRNRLLASVAFGQNNVE